MKPIKNLNCACCGRETQGRQWWNQDTGYGICSKCVKVISKDESEDMERSYGKKGIHYDIEELK